jgi:eukaryotic-like serine/threonine-protein kinase
VQAARSGAPIRVVGRYALYEEIARGGMAAVHLGRLLGPAGFSRTVAIKCLHPHLAADPDFVSMFLDEARLAARIRHPNVVPTLDIVSTGGELFLVMEYVHGESLSRVLRAARTGSTLVPVPLVAAVVAGSLHGLHAAHEATGESGEPLGIVHRDVSPQNILVGVDGVSRVLDFGVAKAVGRAQVTREGQIKGKMAYMAPEQVLAGEVDRRTDVYAAGVVLWEALSCQRLFQADSDGAVIAKILQADVSPPSRFVPGVPAALDAIVMRALQRKASDRFATAREMARALEAAVPLVAPSDVGEWVEKTVGVHLAARRSAVRRVELQAVSDDTPSNVAPGAPQPTRPEHTVQAPGAPADESAGTQQTQLSSSVEVVAAGRRTKYMGLGALVGGVIVAAVLALRALQPSQSSPAAQHAAPPAATIIPPSPTPLVPPPPPSMTVASASVTAAPSAAPSVPPRVLRLRRPLPSTTC